MATATMTVPVLFDPLLPAVIDRLTADKQFESEFNALIDGNRHLEAAWHGQVLVWHFSDAALEAFYKSKEREK